MSQPSLVTQLSHYILDGLWQLQSCFHCFPSNPSLKINGRSFKILRLLGEGGKHKLRQLNKVYGSHY